MIPYDARPRRREIRPPMVVHTFPEHQYHAERPRQEIMTVPFMNPYQRVQQIYHAISRTIPETQRHQILENAVRFLSHSDVELHNYEVDLGMDRALCLQLGYLDMLLSSSSPTAASSDDESTIAGKANSVEQEQILICWCFAHIYQCSRDRRVRSFEEMGQTDLVPILVKILKRYTTSSSCSRSTNNSTIVAVERQQHDTHKTEATNKFNILAAVLQLLRIFARVDLKAKSTLLRWKDGRLMSVIVNLCSENQALSENEQTSVDSQHFEVVGEVFRFFKDLSFRLQESDKQEMYHRVSNLMIQYTAGKDSKSTDLSFKETIMEAIAAVYWNLATSSKLSLVMGRDPRIMTSLGNMLRYRSTTCSDEEHVKIKRNALSALGNIMAALTVPLPIHVNEDTHELHQYQELSSQEWICQTLILLLTKESDKDIQRRAMRTIRCMSSCSWGQNLLLGGMDASAITSQAKELEACLTMMLRRDSVYDVPTRIQACETIGSLTEHETFLSWIGLPLESCLVQMVECMGDEKHYKNQESLVAAACRALILCRERGQWNRELDLPSESFFGSLLACSKLEPETTHPPIAKLLLQIAKDAERVSGDKKQGRQKPSNILSNPLLDTLTELLQPVGPSFDESRSYVLEMLQLFLVNEANKRILVENEGLLTALVGFALVTIQDDKKKSAKQIIMQLVPEL